MTVILLNIPSPQHKPLYEPFKPLKLYTESKDMKVVSKHSASMQISIC